MMYNFRGVGILNSNDLSLNEKISYLICNLGAIMPMMSSLDTVIASSFTMFDVSPLILNK